MAHSPPSISEGRMNATLGKDGWHLRGEKQIQLKYLYARLATWYWGSPVPPSIQGKYAAVAMPLDVETPNHQIA